jgi:adenylate cyclase
MQKKAFKRIAAARAVEALDRLSGISPSGNGKEVLISAARSAAVMALFAGMGRAAQRAYRVGVEASTGGTSLLRLAERLRLVKDLDRPDSPCPSMNCPYVLALGNIQRAPVSESVLSEARRRNTGLYGLRFQPGDIQGGFDEIVEKTVALAVDGSLLGLYALIARPGGFPDGFVVLASGRSSLRSTSHLIRPLDGFPVSSKPEELLAPSQVMPRQAKAYYFVESMKNHAEGPGRGDFLVSRHNDESRNDELTLHRRIRFPIGLKLGLVVSLLLVASLGVMNFLSSWFFLADATVRVEENNHAIAQIAAIKVEDDVRSIADRARLLFELSAGNPEWQDAVLFFSLNPDLLYVGVPGLFELPNMNVLALRGVGSGTPAGLATALAGRQAEGTGVLVSNASALMGTPAIAVSIPYRDARFSGSLVVLATAERYTEALGRRGIVESWLATNSGELLLHVDRDMMLAALDLSANPAVQAMRSSPAGNGQLRYRDTDGVEYLASFRRVDYGDMGVISAAPVGKAFEAVQDIQRRNLYIFGAVLSLAAALSYFFSRTISDPIGSLMNAALQIEAGKFELHIHPSTRDELGALTESFVKMGRGLAEREKIKDAFGKFVNKNVAERAMKGEIRLGGERREATIFFSDIRSFTAISESMQPEQVVEFLNQYMTRMVACVEQTGGAVDKFIGDAIMAVWGVPVSGGRDAASAVDAALLMRQSLLEFNRGRGGPGKPVIRNGCGLNTGPVLAGQIGSAQRMEYTVIGDTVNLASRIEALNKPFGTDILVSEPTLSRLGGKYGVEAMPLIRVKGKTDSLKVYAILRRLDDRSGPRSLGELRSLLGLEGTFQDGLDLMEDDEEQKFEIIGSPVRSSS